VFEEEEKKLEKWKNSIDQVDIPVDKLNMVVQTGFEKAKNDGQVVKRIRIRKRSAWSIVIAAILLISFVTSISMSPTFAKTIASIPGLDRIVALIQQNKSLTAAIENDFYQPLNLSQKKNGITVTLDGVIADKKSMVIFYTVRTDEINKPLEMEYMLLMNEKYEDLTVTDTSDFSPQPESIDEKVYSSIMSIDYNENRTLNGKKLLWAIGLKNGDEVEHFYIPFTFKKVEMDSKKYVINKEVTIEGQRIIVNEVTIDPLRVVVHLEMNPNNTKKFFAMDELKLVDETGETWSTIPGKTYRGDDEWEVHLQSNYFKNPEKFSLDFGKINAIDKDEAFILIDTESKEILKQPSVPIFSYMHVENGVIRFTMAVAEDFNYIPLGDFVDANGKEFRLKYVDGSFIQTSVGKKNIEFELPTESYTNPIRLDLFSYPSWIEEDVEVKIK
jgi:hypothetical protein